MIGAGVHIYNMSLTKVNRCSTHAACILRLMQHVFRVHICTICAQCICTHYMYAARFFPECGHVASVLHMSTIWTLP